MTLFTHKPTVAIIGGGFAGLSAAAVLGQNGCSVNLFEKNEAMGGRARSYEHQGFVFDMGPSWYWMHDVFEKFFNTFNLSTSDFYTLKKLDPGFTVVFEENESLNVPANFESLCEMFESIESGSAANLKKFMEEAGFKYTSAMENLIYQPGLSAAEFLDWDLFKAAFRLDIFSSFSAHIRKYFKHPKILSLLEFPVLFLGAMPKHTPALYSLMNFTGLYHGTFYPMGGFGKVAEAFVKLAEMNGVNLHTHSEVDSIPIINGKASGVSIHQRLREADATLAAADYHHVEQKLIRKVYRGYSEKYWDKKVFAPSCLIFYLGINKKIKKLQHHTLFFDADFEKHAQEIYVDKKWPASPLFYVCCPSKTDPSVAPADCENLFILMPIAIDLRDEASQKEIYFHQIMKRIEKFIGENILNHIIHKREYCVSDFKEDYNAYKGNAYGLANTLFQTALFKPKMKSKKVSNLFFAGQLTTPGPGVPPAIISGQMAAQQILKHLRKSGKL